MAAAYMCDRCGKCFDPKKVKSTYIRASGVYVITPEKAKKGLFERRYETYDFCPECSEWLETWVTVNDNS